MASSSRRTYMTRSAIESRLRSPSVSADHTEPVDRPLTVSTTKSCIFVKEVGRSLGFPSRTITTSQLLVHRVLIFRANLLISSSDLGAACLLVAAKMEETIKRIRDILAHTYLLFTKPAGTGFDPQSVPTAVTDKMRPAVLAAEQIVLDAIGFDFRTTHPHMLFVKMSKMAGVAKGSTALSGWLILADTFFTILPIQYPAVVIAAGALCLAWNLDRDDPKDTTPFILKALFSQSSTQHSSTQHSSVHRSSAYHSSTHQSRTRRSNGCDSRSSRRPNDRPHNGRDSADLRQPRKRPLSSLDMTSEWWTELGVATKDVQSFVRQIVDFYLLFFNSTVLTAEYMERHQNGLPSKEMSHRIGQWQMKLSAFVNSKRD